MRNQPNAPYFVPLSVGAPGTQKSSISPSVEVVQQDRFQIGDGYSLTKGEPMRTALEPVSVVPEGPKETMLKTAAVKSAQNLTQNLDITMSGEALYEGVKMTGALEYLNYIKGSAETITLIYCHSIERSGYSLAPNASYQIKPEALQFFQQSGQEAFAERYGQYFVAGHKYGSMFFAIYRCSSINASRFDQFKLKLGAAMEDLFQVDAAVSFRQYAQAHSVALDIEIRMCGVPGGKRAPDYDKSDPAEVIKVLNWFKDNEVGVELQTLLRTYSYVIPEFKNEVAVAPQVLTRLRGLYEAFSHMRLLYQSLPDQYREAQDDIFRELRRIVEHDHERLISDPEELDSVYAQVMAESVVVGNILDRESAYADVQVSLARHPEPSAGTKRSGNSVLDGYGIRALPRDITGDLTIRKSIVDLSAVWTGWATQIINFEDPTVMIVGWEVRSHWDEFNGEWEKVRNEQACLNDRLSLKFTSDHWRGMYYEVWIYTVPKALYDFG